MGVRKMLKVCPGVVGGGDVTIAAGMLGSGIEISVNGAAGFPGDRVP
jgi:hypothetical protein